MRFSEYLKSYRINKNLKLNKAAQLLGISSSYLSSLENGTRPAPSFELLIKIADVLEMSVNERYRLYDLAAESKQPLTLAEDLNEYIYNNPVIRDMLRYSMKCKKKKKEWEIVFVYIKRNYHY